MNVFAYTLALTPALSSGERVKLYLAFEVLRGLPLNSAQEVQWIRTLFYEAKFSLRWLLLQ